MSQIPRTKLVKAPKATAKNLLRPCLENSLRPLYEGLSGIPVHPGDSEEGLNRRGARDLVNSNATATRRLNEVETRAKL